MNGWNPMRWDCERDGCFNKKRRPKIEVFADCFPGRISFGDVDGWVEIGGAFCVLGWKGAGGVLKVGQRRTYTEFTRTYGNIVFVVEGDAESMEVSSFSWFWAGQQTQSNGGGLESLKERIAAWAKWAKGRNAA